jgi:SET domain-containing protein
MSLSKKIVMAARIDGEKGLFAAADIAQGEMLLIYDGPVLDHPTRLSIQVDDDTHIEGTDDSNSYLNHSCDPNAHVDWDGLCLRAKRDIAAGEEITCDYHTTDYELHEQFACRCGSAKCKGKIKGFKFLTKEEQLDLAPWLPAFLKRKIQPEVTHAAKLP